MQHIQFVVKSHYSLDILEFLSSNLLPQTQSFQNILSHNLVNKNKIIKLGLLCELLKSLVSRFAL